MPSAHRAPTVVLRLGVIYLVGGEEMQFTQNIIWSSGVDPVLSSRTWSPDGRSSGQPSLVAKGC
jgi:hypothetical protein